MSTIDQNDELKACVGKKITIKKGDEEFEGVLQGVSYASVISDAKGNPMQPWLLMVGTKEIHFAPNDGWKLTVL